MKSPSDKVCVAGDISRDGSRWAIMSSPFPEGQLDGPQIQIAHRIESGIETDCRTATSRLMMCVTLIVDSHFAVTVLAKTRIQRRPLGRKVALT